MSFKEFEAEIMKSMQNRFEKLAFKPKRVEKLQRQSYSGLIVSEKEGNLGMTLNLDEFYKELKDGKDMELILKEAEELIMNAEFPVAAVESLRDYRQMRDKLALQMVPIAGNEEMLSAVPHRRMEDLAIVYRIMLRLDRQEEASILLTNENLKSYGITQTRLETDAEEICEKNNPLSVRSMESVLFGMQEDGSREPGLWVIGNDTGRYGAAVIAYPGAMDRIAEKIGTGYYLIPSSIHEMLGVPDRLQMKAKDIDCMIAGVNSSEVAPEERLSGHCYHYDPEEKRFESGKDYEERIRRKEM